MTPKQALEAWAAANPRPGKRGEFLIWVNADGTFEWRKKPRGTDTATGMGFPELVGLDPDSSEERAFERALRGITAQDHAAAATEGKEARLRRGVTATARKQDAALKAAEGYRKVSPETVVSLWHESGETGNPRHGRLKWIRTALAERGVDISEDRLSDILEAQGIRPKQ